MIPCVLVIARHHACYAPRAGFVRLAIQQRAALVPVLAMGELDTLRNLIDMPNLQACP